MLLMIIAIVSFSSVFAAAQGAGGAAGAAAASAPGPGPRGFRSITLGMDMESVKKLLATDSLFNYRGEPDVLFTPDRKRTIIDCSGNSFIDRAYFQFSDNRLYIITIVLNARVLDYYTMFTTLVKKYGESTSLDPDAAVWSFSATRMSLEKPLRVKYIAIDVFTRLKDAGVAAERVQDMTRARFLEEF